MKYLRLRPVHWFSVGILVFLVIFLNRPDNIAPKMVGAAPGQIVTAYRVVSSADDQWLEAFSVRLPPHVEPMLGSLRVMTLLKPEESPLPPGTRVLSVTLRDNGVAWADFSAAFVRNFPGGSLRESLAINSVLLTLSQFPDVRAVQFTVEGKVISSLGGHEDISGPQEVGLGSSNVRGGEACEDAAEQHAGGPTAKAQNSIDSADNPPQMSRTGLRPTRSRSEISETSSVPGNKKTEPRQSR